MPQSLDSLNQNHSLADRLRFEAGEGGLTRAVITTDTCTGSAYLHGGHVASWRPTGGEEVLWLSGKSNYATGQPIRGGVPICFPWFGPNANDPAAPAHGTVRTRAWGVARTAADHTGVTITFHTAEPPWDVRLAVTFGKTLTTALVIVNDSETQATCEAALHTYFTVGDVKQARITGLSNTAYLDKVGGLNRRNQGSDPITFTAETDRVYLNTTARVTLEDPALRRRIILTKRGSDATVVWNPWIDKAAKMPDFGDHEWPGMCCIETANVGDHAMTLAPGASHTMSATIHAESL